MDPTQKKCVVPLDKDRRLMFDGNAMAAFEEKNGRHFLEFMADIQDAQAEAEREFPNNPARQQSATVRAISLTSFCDMVWAACVEYNGRSEPQWPLSQTQVRRFITLNWMNQHTARVFEAFQEQGPDREDLPMRLREETTEVRPMTDAERSTRVDGGRPSGALDDSTSVSATPTSAD